MSSSTKNVKLGVCKVCFAGTDLGYTKGGVEVSVKTDTHKVNIDQFGKTSINELIMGREITAKVPMAETTIENLAITMPGATIVQTGGTVASGTITFSTAAAAANDTVTVNGTVFTFKAAPATAFEVAPGATFGASADNLYAALIASADQNVNAASYTHTAGTGLIAMKYGTSAAYGIIGKQTTDGNAFTLVKTFVAPANCVVSGATLTGGANPTSTSVSVATGIGTDLLSIAKELRFRPVSKYNAAGVFTGDITEDFAIPLAGTAGALNFAYKLEDERVFSVEFTGYPDSTTGKLFTIGV